MGPSSDRMAGLASHVIGQSSQYPLYPALPGSGLDTSSYSQLQLPCLPDLLLLPSDLNPFAKVLGMEGYCSVQRLQQQQQQEAKQEMDTSSGGLSGTPTRHVSSSSIGRGVSVQQAAVALAVNPGRLAKGAGGGTFAHMWVMDGSVSAGTGAEAGSSSVAQRCRVEIRRV